MDAHGQLVARDAELELVGSFLARTPAELPAALVLEGEAGIGKTVLWREGVGRARADDGAVLTSALTHGEATLAFAGLADLVGDVWDDVADELAPPQRAALEHALLLGGGPGTLPDERAVAFGFLGLVRALASDGPLTIAIDDLQWLDPSSTAMLSYMLRRLRREPVRFLLAQRREDGIDPDPLRLEHAGGIAVETVPVGALTLGALHRLLRMRLGHSLNRPALSTIHRASNGNPLHALELARSLEEPSRETMGTLQGLLLSRVTALPGPTRDVLLHAALSVEPTLALLGQAGIADARDHLAEAVAAELVSLDGDRIRLSHPLVAGAASDAASDSERRAAHRALAAVARSDEDRARHLGNSAHGPDESVAQALEGAARISHERGARAVSAQLFTDAAHLTPAGDERAQGRRLVEAGRAHFESGDSERAEVVLTQVIALLRDGPERVEAEWRLGTILDETGRWREAMRRWQDALELDGGQELRAEILRSLAIMTVYTGSISSALAYADEAIAVAEASGRDDRLAFALSARALISVLTGDGVTARALLLRARELEQGVGELFGEWSPTAVAAECARHTGATDEARCLYEALLTEAVARGDAATEQWAAFGAASAYLLLGRYDVASTLSETVLEIADQTGVMRIPARMLRAGVLTHVGDLDAADALLTDAIALAEDENEAMHLYNALIGAGSVAVSRNENAAALELYARARTVVTEVGTTHATMLRTLLYECETAAAVGSISVAEEALAAFLRAAGSPPPAWAAPIHARATAAIQAARGDFDVATETLIGSHAADPGELPLEVARSHLLLGVILRRMRRHAEARAELDLALAGFERLGAQAWVTRARSERDRIPGRRRTETHELTEAERRIAELVALGHSNRATAEALFLSVKTVEVTLTRVYRKLGVRSRGELAARFGRDAKH